MIRTWIQWLVRDQRWRWAAFVTLFALTLPTAIYHFATLDHDLSNEERRQELSDRLEKEMKQIPLPPRSAINKFETLGKSMSSVLVHTRFRTELPREQFLVYMQEELIERSWVPRSGNGSAYFFCRGKLDASLESGGKGAIWSDGADYWTLSFSLGFRTKPLLSPESLPEACQE